MQKEQYEYQKELDAFNIDMAQKNYQMAVDQMNWQQQAQQTAWSREDNAIQRRVADLTAAGLNKYLAAGQGASSSGVTASNVSGVANQINSGAKISPVSFNSSDSFLTGVQRANDISLTQKQVELLDSQIDNVNADTSNKFTYNGKMIAETEAIYKRIYNESEELLLKKQEFEALQKQYQSIQNKNSAEAVKIRQEAELLQLQQHLRLKELNAYEQYLQMAQNESDERIQDSKNTRANRTANTVNSYLNTVLDGLQLFKFW